jgi:DNA-binding PadR family transcriptional regulator
LLVQEAAHVTKEPSQGYQLRVVQEVLLALLAKEASHGYQLRARLQLALGPLAEALNAGQVYVTLTRLEKAGLVTSERVGQTAWGSETLSCSSADLPTD